MQLPLLRIGENVTDNNERVRTNGETQALELWASAEICEALGWTRARLKLEREADFPEPIGVVAAGRIAVWDASAVRAWYAVNAKSEPRWRRQEAVRMYRRGESIAEIHRQLKAKRDSVRKWLRDAGETLPGDASA